MKLNKYGNIILGVAVLCCALFTIGAADAEDTVLIKKLVVQGNQRIESDAILRVVKTKVGDPFNADLLSEDLQSIYAMGWFDDVRVEVDKQAIGHTVFFVVQEKSTIREIKISGNDEIDDEKIMEAIDISSGSILNIFKIRRNILAIESLYKADNYHNAKVTYKTDPLEHNQADLEFVIDEGKKIRIKTISFDGNTAYTAKELKKKMETSEKGFFSWLTSSGDYDKEKLQQDVYLITDFYQNTGYAEAKVGDPEIEYKEEWIYVLIKINEGPHFKMGKVDLAGEYISPREEMLSKVTSGSQEYYNREAIRQDMLTLTDLYADQGFAHAEIVPEINTDHEKLTVDLTFHLKKNEPVYFERINIHGNTKTRDKVIRREFKVSEQELYSSSKLKRSIADLHRLDYFEDIKVNPQPGSAKDKVLLDIEVKEKATGTFTVGGGYSGIDKLYAMASVSERNFMGKGQILECAVQTGGTARQYTMGFTEPWLFDIPLSAGVDAYKMEREYDEYDRDSTGGGIRMGYPLFDYVRGYVRYGYDSSTIDDISPSASPYILPGRSVESSISTSIVYDSRNRAFNPSEGSKHDFTVKYAGLGGDIGYTEFKTETGWYFPLFWSTVGFLHGEGGYIFENSKYLPDYDRYYLGGINSVRGYDWQDISPINSDGIKIGGTEYAQFNVEYLVPIIKDSGLVGLVFFDAGNAWADEGDSYNGLRKSSGFGIRWFSPMGPLRLERGYIIDRQPGEDSGRWEFSMGGTF
ncbi:MAG: outer membrane protein assembly factor BamA [Desulfosalsimonadaceae bacterium]